MPNEKTNQPSLFKSAETISAVQKKTNALVKFVEKSGLTFQEKSDVLNAAILTVQDAVIEGKITDGTQEQKPEVQEAKAERSAPDKSPSK